MNSLHELTHLVERWTGIRPGTIRGRDALVRYAEARARFLGLPDLGSLAARIEAEGPGGEEFRRLARVVSNGQTYFFRDASQLEELVAMLAERHAGRTADVWIAGCSTGEEAYTLAILCAERGVRVRILATDLHEERVEQARLGVYDDWSLRRVPPPTRERYFETAASGHRVRDSIRNRVTFAVHNLVGDAAPTFLGRRVAWSAIVCRNVLIYFAVERIRAICSMFADELAPDGVLVLGASESLQGMDVNLAPVTLGTRTAYRSSVPPPPSRPPVAVVAADESESWRTTPVAIPRIDGFTSTELGHDCLRSHAFEDALAHYEDAVRLEDLDAEAHFFVGLARIKLGDRAGALLALRRALFLEPNLWPASLLLAGVHERRHDGVAALRELRSARRVVERSRGPYPFRSEVRGIAAASLTAEEAISVVDRRWVSVARNEILGGS